MFKRAQTDAAHPCRSMLRRAPCARPRLRLTLFAVAGVSLAFALTASAGVASGLSASRDHTEAAAATSPLSVAPRLGAHGRGSDRCQREDHEHDRCPRVRSTTGALGLISGPACGPTGAGTFSVASLPSQSSRTVRFTTRRCAISRSGRGRFRSCSAPTSTARSAASRRTRTALVVGTLDDRRRGRFASASGPVPNTIVRSGSRQR